MSVEPRHSVWLAIGGTLVVVGGGGLITLELSGQGSHFRPVELVLLVITLVGAYGLFGPLTGLPLPSPRSHPFWRHQPRREGNAVGVPQATLMPPPLPSMLAVPALPVERANTEQPRRLLKRTPRQLMELYGALTDVQGKLLIAPYIGQWIQLDGTVSDVSSSGDLIHLQIKEHPSVAVWFKGPDDLKRLLLLQPGDPVVVQGQIERIERHWVSLDPCELVES